jgi:hypothetical protein
MSEMLTTEPAPSQLFRTEWKTIFAHSLPIKDETPNQDGVGGSDMNCLPNQLTNAASGQGQVVASFLAAEATFRSSSPEHRESNELELEAEMHRRAGAITDVLAKIMEEPVAFRHWGLNE